MREVVLLSLMFMSVTPLIAGPTVSKPSNIALTIYNDNFALVKEVRAMSLSQGPNYVAVQDVAATIEPSSVAFKSLTDPNGVAVREQNYQYDLINPATILDKSVGKRVRVRRIVEGKITEEEGVLLSTAQNGRVIQTSEGVLIDPIGEIQVKELPEGLVSRPTLVWKLEVSKAGNHQTEVSYIANQISWIADYVAVVDPLDKYIDLTGWVTLTNNSGVTFENASLNLMAGDVRRVPRESPGIRGYVQDKAMLAEFEPQFTEKSFFEYHLYTLQGKTTVRDKESKQLTLIQAARIPVKKLFIYDGRLQWWRNWRWGNYRPGESYDVSSNKKVNVVIEVSNTKENHLGIPLPKGKVKVYKEDAEVNQQFIGEDEIDHTPKDEKIRLYIGDAFDVVGEHKRINFRRISQTEVEETFEISLRNHKDSSVTVTVVEHLTGDWNILNCSHQYAKKDASTVEIPVEVPKNGEAKIIYTVRTKW